MLSILLDMNNSGLLRCFSYVYIRMLLGLTEIIEVHLERFLLKLMVVGTSILVVTGVLYDT